ERGEALAILGRRALHRGALLGRAPLELRALRGQRFAFGERGGPERRALALELLLHLLHRALAGFHRALQPLALRGGRLPQRLLLALALLPLLLPLLEHRRALVRDLLPLQPRLLLHLGAETLGLRLAGGERVGHADERQVAGGADIGRRARQQRRR